MKRGNILIFGLLAAAAATADAREAMPATEAASQVGTSGAAPENRPYKHRMSFPAAVLSYYPSSTAFTRHGDGLDWNGTGASVTLTVRRPLDYSGGNVRITLFHYVPVGAGDPTGDISFGVTPVAFSHGSFFETYDGVAFNTVSAPIGDVLLEQSAVIPPVGMGPFGTGGWWYFSIGRSGDYSDTLRLMAVSIDYY